MSLIRTLFLAATVALAPAAMAAQTIKIATVAPEGSGWVREMRAGADAIKAGTEGRVEIKYFPGGVMGTDAGAVLRKIRLGQLQGAAFSTAELSLVDPDVQVLSLPFLFADEAEVDAVRRATAGALESSVANRGMVVLGAAGGGFAYLMSTRELRTRDDLRGAKVWSPGGDDVAKQIFEAFGVQPTQLPIADVYVGLSTGLVDTVGNTPSGAIIFQWHTRLKYVIDLPLTYVIGYLAVDKKAFDRMSAEDQAVVRREMNAAFARIEAANRKDNESARAALVQQGIEFVVPDAAERAAWEGLGREAIATMKSRGLFGTAMYDTVAAAREAHRKGAATGGSAPAP